MKNKIPLVSVVLPVYNCEDYISEAIQSILNQTFTRFELIVVDDGSNDRSLEIVNGYLCDPRVIVRSRKNLGLVASLNEGIEIAKSNLIARMDADDIALPNRLQVQYDNMCSNQDIAVLGSFIQVISESGDEREIITYPNGDALSKEIMFSSPVAHPAVIMRKDIIVSLGGYREAFIHAEDYDLWLRIYDSGYKISNLKQVLLRYRQTESGITRKFYQSQAITTRVAQLAHHMRIKYGTDSFNGSERVGLKQLSEYVGEFISENEFYHYELLANENMVKEYSDIYGLAISNKAKSLYFCRLARDIYSSNILYSINFAIRAFYCSPSLFISRFLKLINN
ncbi:glycosyltransferase [Vibrio cionasavignyae]|uniref:glycosyltransferase n=1 Tax=Vibrio cionasavignyae TaxID=2910252 RepID=UPI003D0DD5EC